MAQPAFVKFSTMSNYDYVYLYNLKLCLLWLCFPNIYITIFSLFYFFFIIFLQFNNLFILNNQWNQFIFLTSKEDFYFRVCSLCLCCQPRIHSNDRNSFVSSPFLLLFVSTCCPISPEFPSMFAFTVMHSFTFFSSKGSCSSVVISSCRPTWSLFHVPVVHPLT